MAQLDSDRERSAFGRCEVARRWGTSVKTIDRMVRAGKLSTFQVGTRVLIKASAVFAIEDREAG